MAVKSILEIDVDDSKFKAFADLYKKYQDALAKSPDLWGAVDKEVKNVDVNLTSVSAALLAQNEILHKTADNHSKIRRELESTDRAMVSLGRSSWRVFQNIRDTTLSLLKWSTITGVTSGLMGFGGLFGFEQLAASARGARNSSLGLGVAPGQLQAANIVYGSRIGNVGGALGRIADIQNDVTQRYLLTNRLGISGEDVENKNAAELLPEVLTKLREKYLAIPKQLRGTLAESYGLTQFGLSSGDLRGLGNLSPGELQGLNAQFPGAVKQIGGSSEVDRRYTDFLMKLETVGQSIKNNLIDKLVPLAGPLEKLSQAAGDLATSALSSDAFKTGIADFSKFLESVAKGDYAGTFQKFVDAVKYAGEQLYALAQFLHLIPEDPKTRAAEGLGPNDSKFGNAIMGLRDRLFGPMPQPQAYTMPYGGGGGGGIQNIAYYPNRSGAGQFGGLERQYGLPAGLLSRVRQVESGGNDLSISSAGAMGPFQFMPGTAKDLGVTNPFDVNQAAPAAAKYFQQLLGMFGGDLEQAAAAYNWGAGNVRRDLSQHGANWKQFLPRETAEYIEKVTHGLGAPTTYTAQAGQGVNIRITQPTGGNLVGVSANLGAVGAVAA